MASESPENHPKLWKWRLEWLAQTWIEKLAGLFPGPLVFRLGEVLGGLAWFFMKSRRRIVLRNLRIALHGEYDLPTLRTMTRQSFRRTGANLISALHTAGVSARKIDQIVTFENVELLEETLRRSPGLVLMPCHMGNWEILTRVHHLLPVDNAHGALYRPLNNPLLDARVLAQREQEGTRLFSKRDSFHAITGFIREGGILGILADQRVGYQGEVVPFFGRLTRSSPLPSLIARRGKCDVLGMSLITDAPGKWRIRFHALNGPATTANCMETMERSMKASPLDVFWFQERWKVYLNHKHTLRVWLGKDDMRGNLPHRALLWRVDAPESWQVPDDWTHPDVIYETVTARDFGQDAQTTDKNVILQRLEKIDAAAALPIDFILACNASKALQKAARRLSIPLVSLPATP